MNKELNDALTRLATLNRQRDGLYQDLRRSLALQEIWPDAFEHGRCTSRVTGNPRSELTFVLTLGNGEQREKPLQDIPVILWSEQVKNDIRRLGPHHARKFYTLLKKGEA